MKLLERLLMSNSANVQACWAQPMTLLPALHSLLSRLALAWWRRLPTTSATLLPNTARNEAAFRYQRITMHRVIASSLHAAIRGAATCQIQEMLLSMWGFKDYFVSCLLSGTDAIVPQEACLCVV